MKEIISQSDKVRNLRNSLNITQITLAKLAKISRSALAHIENGNRKISDDIAASLEEAFSVLIENSGLKLNKITKEELLEDEEKQIKNIISMYLQELRALEVTNNANQIFEKINEINEFSNKYKIDEPTKIEILECIAQGLMGIQELEKSLKYFEQYKNLVLRHTNLADEIKLNKDIDINKFKFDETKDKFQKLLPVFYNMQVIKFMLKEHNSAISLGFYVVDIVNEYSLNDTDIIPRIIYNNAFGYFKINEIEKCLEVLELLLDKYNYNTYTNQKGENLKAKCLLKKGEINQAQELWLKQLDFVIKSTEDNEKIAILENICWTYIDQDNYEEVLKYAELIEQFDFDKLSKHNQLRNYYYFLYIESYLKREAYVLELFHICFHLSAKLNDKDIQYKTCLILARFYIENEEDKHKEAFKLAEYINKCFKEVISEKVRDVLHEISEYFIDSKKRDAILNMATRIRRKFYIQNEFDI